MEKGIAGEQGREKILAAADGGGGKENAPAFTFQDASELLGLKPIDIRTYSPLTMAYIGDAVYELAVRTVLVNRGNCKPNKLHRRSSSLVKASAQAEALQALRKELTAEELDIVRRGRNAKPASIAKNATARDYHQATAFETLIGYFYLTGRLERMFRLVRRSLEILEGKEIV